MSHEVDFMTRIAPRKLRSQLQTVASSARGRGWLEHHILVTPISWSLRGDRVRAVWVAARSLDAVSFHDSGRSL